MLIAPAQHMRAVCAQMGWQTELVQSFEDKMSSVCFKSNVSNKYKSNIKSFSQHWAEIFSNHHSLKSLIPLSSDSGIHLIRCDDYFKVFSDWLGKSEKYKMFRRSCLFPEWHTPYCERACGLFMSWGCMCHCEGLLVLPSTAMTAKYHSESGRAANIHQNSYVGVSPNDDPTVTQIVIHRLDWFAPDIFLTNMSRFDGTETHTQRKWDHTKSRQTLLMLRCRGIQSFCLLIKTGLQWNVVSPQGSACRLLQSASARNRRPVRTHKRPQWGGWTTGVTGLVKGKW